MGKAPAGTAAVSPSRLNRFLPGLARKDTMPFVLKLLNQFLSLEVIHCTMLLVTGK